MWNAIRNRRKAWPWLSTLAAVVAVAAVGVYVTNWNDPVAAQQSACADLNVSFDTLRPMAFRSRGDADQFTLTWLGPGVVDGDTQNATCTWRTDADFTAAQSNDHSSPSLYYTVERKAPGETDFTALSTLSHGYSADGLGTVKQQLYAVSAPVNGQTTYRVNATWGGRNSRYASLTVSRGAAPTPDETDPGAPGMDPDNPEGHPAWWKYADISDPPERVICFYEMGGELHTVSLPECSAEALAEAWDIAN